MSFTAAYGLLAHGLIFGAIAALLPLGLLRQKAALVATAVALLAGIAPAMHAFFGPPSTTLLCLALLQLRRAPLTPLNPPAALTLLAFAALFYPAALGWGNFDPYALGYQPWTVLAALLPLGMALWLRGHYLWLLILSAAPAAWAAGLFSNLWDALFDPLLVGVAALSVLREQTIRFIAARRR